MALSDTPTRKAPRRRKNSPPARLLPEAQDIGARLMAGRMRKQWTQSHLGILLGLDQRVISRWEQGAVSPTAMQLLAVCTALELEPGTVLAPLAA